MSIFYHKTSTKNNCPVCGNLTKGCSTDTVTEITFCRGEQINDDYVFTGYDSRNVFGVYVLSDRFYGNKGVKKRSNSSQVFKQTPRKNLPEADRDVKARSLLEVTTIGNRHLRDLRRRGLTKEQAIAHGIRSVYYNENLAISMEGVAGFDKNRYIGKSGYLCPVRDIEGRIVAFQVRTSSRDAKYLWLRTNVNGDDGEPLYSISSHLLNGELPYNFVGSIAQAPLVGLCEGVLKPFVAHVKHGLPMVGVSGGHFKSGSEQLVKLADIARQKGTKFVFFPDSGSLLNADVSRVLLTNIRLFREVGLEVAFADWGQLFDDRAKDIDEIDDITGIKYYSSVDFESLITEKGARKEVELQKDFLDAIANWLEIKPRPKLKAKFQESQNKEEVVYEKGVFNVLKERLDQGQSVPKVVIPKDQDLTEVYQEALRAGISRLLDISGTGSGKTFAASYLDPNACFIWKETDTAKRKYFYLSQSPRNPHSSRIEDFRLLPARHLGYDVDYSRKLESGEPYIVATEDITKPDIESNCKLARHFQKIRELNIEQSVCNSCSFKRQCQFSSGEGYGYKAQVRSALSASKIRANIQAVTPDMTNSNTITVVDEYSKSIPWLRTLEINVKEFSSIAYRLYLRDVAPSEDKDLEFNEALQKINKFFAEFNLKILDLPESRYGYTTVDLLSNLTIPDFEVFEVLISYINAQNAKRNQEGFVGFGKVQEKFNNYSKLYTNWFEDFIYIVTRKDPHSSLFLKDGKFKMVRRNQRAIDTLNNNKAVIYQDATGSAIDLSMKLGVDVNTILVIEKENVVSKNLKIVQVEGLGNLGNQRAESMSKRVLALREQIEQLYPDCGFIEYKKYAQADDLVHFSDSRGSNRFQDRSCVASFGSPTQNLASLLGEYEVYSGQQVSLKDKGFQAYVGNAIASELYQELGRLRANRRLETKLVYYFIGDTNIDFVGKDFEFEKQAVYDFCPKAAGKVDQVKRLLGNVFQQIKNVTDATQVEVAKVASVSLSKIKYLSKLFGGWLKLKEVLKAMFFEPKASPVKERNDLQEIDYIIADYLPVVIREKNLDEFYHVLNTYKDYRDRIMWLLDEASKFLLISQTIGLRV